MRVDVVDWHTITGRFQQIIEQECVAIWNGRRTVERGLYRNESTFTGSNYRTGR
jgi:hypothetical protein